MATIHYACHHEGSDGTWARGRRDDSGICPACRSSRIGETIPFARHGAAPSSGQSRNHRDDTGECGLSVYEMVDGTIQYVGWWYGIAERPLYLGTGRIVRWGSDGEPCVAVDTLTRATKAQTRRLLRAGDCHRGRQ